MDQRREFVRLAMQEGANRRELCRRFGIHPDTGYKWIGCWLATGEIADRSRRPKTSPAQTKAAMEAAVLVVRDAHPAWGARKIARCIEREGHAPPAVSTVHEILRRHNRIKPPPGGAAAACQRFEMEAPNQLWQMDFKGWIKLGNGKRCYPLTVVDDHSRYAIGIESCADEKGATVRPRLEKMFHRYGLPEAFFVDNGTPWGDAGQSWTRFGVFLLKLGIKVLHSRPYHPQSRGKNERFHRTLAQEVFAFNTFRDHEDVQPAFDDWREVYNFVRPHQALDHNVPADRYRPSSRTMPDRLPEITYDEGEIVRAVPITKAYIRFKGKLWKVPEAFSGERVAVRPLAIDGRHGVFFASHQIATIDLTNPKSVGHVSEQVSVMSPD